MLELPKVPLGTQTTLGFSLSAQFPPPQPRVPQEGASLIDLARAKMLIFSLSTSTDTVMEQLSLSVPRGGEKTTSPMLGCRGFAAPLLYDKTTLIKQVVRLFWKRPHQTSALLKTAPARPANPAPRQSPSCLSHPLTEVRQHISEVGESLPGCRQIAGTLQHSVCSSALPPYL